MADKEELVAELDQCLTAHAMLNDKVCDLEEENAVFANAVSSATEDRDHYMQECAELKARIKELEVSNRLQSYSTSP